MNWIVALDVEERGQGQSHDISYVNVRRNLIVSSFTIVSLKEPQVFEGALT